MIKDLDKIEALLDRRKSLREMIDYYSKENGSLPFVQFSDPIYSYCRLCPEFAEDVCNLLRRELEHVEVVINTLLER